MKNDKIVLGSAPAADVMIDINTSKLNEPFKGCIVANILCGEYVDDIIYGIFSIDLDNHLLVFTAENEDVYKFSFVQEDEEDNSEPGVFQ